MSSLRLKFGKNLRRLRLQREFTQEHLAEASEISVDFLSLVERGHNAPSFETLESLATALRISVAELFTFHEHTGAGSGKA
ncbi:MAG: helix-turn-helix transcriptional regulator [Acidobacteriota bacterium]